MNKNKLFVEGMIPFTCIVLVFLAILWGMFSFFNQVPTGTAAEEMELDLIDQELVSYFHGPPAEKLDRVEAIAGYRLGMSPEDIPDAVRDLFEEDENGDIRKFSGVFNLTLNFRGGELKAVWLTLQRPDIITTENVRRFLEELYSPELQQQEISNFVVDDGANRLVLSYHETFGDMVVLTPRTP